MKRMMRRGALGSMALSLVAAGIIAFPAATFAKDGDIRRTGDCSGRSDWKLKVSPEGAVVVQDYSRNLIRLGSVVKKAQ